MQYRKLFAVVSIAFLLTACGSKNSSSSVVPPSSTTESTAVATAQSLVVMRNQHLQVLNQDGALVRDVRDLSSGGELSGAWVSTDGTNIYYEVDSANSDSLQGGAIFRVPFNGGDSTQVALGSFPTISPDSKTLAYVKTDANGVGTIVLHSIAGGADKTLSLSADHQSIPPPIQALAWSRDNKRLAVAFTGGQDVEQHDLLINVVQTAVNYDQGVNVQDSVNKSWRGWPAFMPDGSLFALNACCMGFPPHEFDNSQMVVIDSNNGNVLRTIATGEGNEDHSMLGVSHDGTLFTWLTNSTLHESVNGAASTTLGDGYLAAAWTP